MDGSGQRSSGLSYFCSRYENSGWTQRSKRAAVLHSAFPFRLPNHAVVDKNRKIRFFFAVSEKVLFLQILYAVCYRLALKKMTFWLACHNVVRIYGGSKRGCRSYLYRFCRKWGVRLLYRRVGVKDINFKTSPEMLHELRRVTKFERSQYAHRLHRSGIPQDMDKTQGS